MHTRIKQISQEWRSLTRLAIMVGVLGASVVLGAMASKWLVLLVVAAVGGVILFTGLLRWMEVGLLFLIPISFLLPWGIGTGTETEINLTIIWLILLLGVWIIKMVVSERRVTLRGSRVNLPSLVFIAVTFLAMLAGRMQWMVFTTEQASIFSQIGGVLMLVLPVCLLLLTANVIQDDKWIRGMVWIFLGLGVIYTLAMWIPGGGILTGRFNQKAVSAVFFIWSTALTGGMWLFNDSLKGWRRWGMGVLLALTVGTGFWFMRTHASTWFSILIVLGVLVWLKSWRIGLLLSLVVVVFGMWQYDAIIERIFRVEEYSAITRAATWPIMWELVKASPILGLGPSNYYFYTPLFSLMGYYIKFNSHNNYWDIAAQVGLVGLGVFVWLAATLGATGIKLRRVVKQGFSRGYVNGAIAGMVGTLAVGMLGDWFMPFVYNIGFDGFRGAVFAWLFLGGMLAYEQMLQQGKDV